jgi:hypothetical protein
MLIYLKIIIGFIILNYILTFIVGSISYLKFLFKRNKKDKDTVS